MVDSHESDALLVGGPGPGPHGPPGSGPVFIWSIPTKVMHIGKKTNLLHSRKFISLYRRQKIYEISLYIIVAP